MTVRNFLIYAPPFTHEYGGIVALHKLCDVINRAGGRAFIHPYLDLIEVNALNIDQALDHCEAQRAFYDDVVAAKKFPVKAEFITPVTHVFNDLEYGDDWIIVYPEITSGNPLRAKNIVRWLLHNPGFHTGRINYGPNELYFRYSNAFDEFRFPGSRTSESFLKIEHWDFGLFNSEGAAASRFGSAYCVRKGWTKPIQHDLTYSILIDGRDLEEIARIFKKVKVFYSYDTRTAFSHLAVLCGCDSVVIPDSGVPESEWASEGEELYSGIAYGIENLDKARMTAPRLKPYLLGAEQRTVQSVVSFMKEADEFFNR